MAAMEYLDFDLAVEATPTPGTYQVSVLASPRGEASGQMVFPFNADALENVILKLGRTRTGVRSLGSPTQSVAEKFGRELFDALFAGEVGSRFESSLDEAADSGKGLRIRLRLGRAPQLADVPWEYLYWASRRRFLVLSSKTPVVRYLEQPRSVTPLLVTPPLQVLLVVSSPTDLATLDVAAEVQRINGALAGLEGAGQVQVTVLQTASLGELSRALRRGPFHVLHFIGHGGFNDSTGEGMLAFTDDETGRARLVSGGDLATLLQDHDTLRLVLLNACEGGRQSPADPLGGVAQALVSQGVPAVIAMQFEITDAAATRFSAEFYAAIADGYPIDASLAEARRAVYSDNNDVEWGTPVLYLRASDGRIFDVAGKPAAASAVPTAPDAPAGEAGARVVPVVVPPWTPPQPEPEQAQQPPIQQPPIQQPPAGPASPVAVAPGGGGVSARSHPARWAILGAAVAVVALILFVWRPFPLPWGSSTETSSPHPTPTDTVTQSGLPTTPTPSRSTRRQTPTLPPVRQVGTLQAERVTTPLTIDGRTGDWAWQYVARATNPIAGNSSATANVYLMWDSDALYVLADVTDSRPRPPDPDDPRRTFRGDSVILELGPDKRGLAASDLARPTDAYYMFGVPDQQQPLVAVLKPNAEGTSFELLGDASGIQSAIGLSETGYVLEARIPWGATGLNQHVAGTVLAANVNVSERKSGGFANLGMRSTNPQRTAEVRAHPAYWHDLQLRA